MLAVVVDTGLGNLRSVEKALETAGSETARSVSVVRSADPAVLRRADRLVVPGQGGFGACASALGPELREVLLERLAAGVPYLGICLGLQILFESSEEAPNARGLGIFPGKVVRLQRNSAIKIPHMGWNQLDVKNGGHPLLDAAGGSGAWLYFVHSFHAEPADRSVIKANVEYGPNLVTAAVARDNVVATQFHPEKSQRAGLALLGAFLGGDVAR
jgi:glutamine amidotransferase